MRSELAACSSYCRFCIYREKAKKLKILDNEYGFRKERSTVDAVINFINGVFSSYDKSKMTIAFCLDLSKAFDSEQSILINNLDLI